MSDILQYDVQGKARRFKEMPDGSFSEVLSAIGSTVTTSVGFARPANATPYSAKDAVSNSASAPAVLTFENAARAPGGSGYVTKARLMTDQAANVARFRLHLFHTAPTPINDNAAHTLLWANRANRVGHIDFDSMQTEGVGSDAANTGNYTSRVAFVCPAESQALYGMLEVLDAFTPASGQLFYVELSIEQN